MSFGDVENPEDYIDFMHSEKFRRRYGYREQKVEIKSLRTYGDIDNETINEENLISNIPRPSGGFFRSRSVRKF